MKIRATCPVDSLTVLRDRVEIEHNGKLYTFIPNDQNYLSEIQLVATVNKPEEFNSTWKKEKPDDKQETVSIKHDSEQIAAIRAEFQELESLLALTHNVKRIYWDGLRYDLIFESPEERKITDVTGFNITFEYPDRPKLAEPEHLHMVVRTKERLGKLTVPLAFYREAMRDHVQHRYINAFYNFYFILEGFYGGGKWRNHQVADEFKNSELKGLLDTYIKNNINPDPITTKRLTDMINEMNVNNAGRQHYTPQILDADGILTLIVDTRGSLLHFNLDDPEGTPFNHQDYRHLEVVLLYLATVSLTMKLGGAKIPITELMAKGLGINPSEAKKT